MAAESFAKTRRPLIDWSEQDVFLEVKVKQPKNSNERRIVKIDATTLQPDF